VIVLISLGKGDALPRDQLKHRIDKICTGRFCIDIGDLDNALGEMASEGLINTQGETVQLTEQGSNLGGEWRSLLLKGEPILEVVAGVTDGSITGLVVILSAFIAGLAVKTAALAALLTLSAVAITNFSSFLLGGTTEDMADMKTLQNLMNYSLSDIADKRERDKSLLLVKSLFIVLHREISRTNIFAAITCGATTFLSGIIPIVTYLMLPPPYGVILSLSIVGVAVGVFLVRYRSQRAKVHWKVTLLETALIVAIAVVASLLLGSVYKKENASRMRKRLKSFNTSLSDITS
jgi:VIT1/CCC1 family predicted Fe2+/Mn2+ transporter